CALRHAGAPDETSYSGQMVSFHVQPSEPTVPGLHFDLDRVWLCLSYLLQGKVSLRAVPRLLEVFDSYYGLDQPDEIPDWTTSRMWLMRLGLGQLRLPVARADDSASFVHPSLPPR